MNRFTAFTAAIVLAATLSSVAAKAEYYYGPLQNGNQCWNKHMTNGFANSGYGYWGECPKPASTTTTTVTRRVRHTRHQ
jgi:hypothetical protein